MPDLPPSKLRIFQWSFYPSLCWKPTTWVLPSKCIKDQTSSCHIPSPVPPLSKSLSSLTWKIAEGFPGFHTCSPTGFSQNSSQHNPFKKNTSLLCSELSINAPFHSVKATVCTMTPHDLAVHCLSLMPLSYFISFLTTCSLFALQPPWPPCSWTCRHTQCRTFACIIFCARYLYG